MSKPILFSVLPAVHWRRAACAAALSLVLPACGGAPAPVVATGKIGREVSASARSVPQGAEVCALKEAIAAQPGGADKPLSETCGKALKSDELWRRSMMVLGAHAETLDALAAGGKGETTGPLEAAMTGVSGSGDWIDVDDGAEKGAREAASQLVTQMKNNTANGDLEKAVKDAAPHVRTLCDGLAPYLQNQAKAIADVAKEIEKRRAARKDARCGMLDNRNICVSESGLDRATYGQMFGHLTELQDQHEQAFETVTAFCAAHKKLEDAAAKGALKDDGTYREIVEAVKAAHKPPEAAAADTAKPGAAPKK